MVNPYEAPTDMAAESSWRDLLARITAIVLHLVLWVAFIALAGPILGRYIGDPMVPDAQVTMLQSFNRFVLVYGFLAVILCFVLDIGVWIALRRFGRRVRWRWLAITSALIPITTIATWLIFGPVLFE